MDFFHRYQFPVQDHAIDRALDVHDPRTKNSAGTLVDIDEINLTVDLKRGKILEKPHPTALIPNDYVGSKKQVESLMRIARWVVENGLQEDVTGCGGKPPFPTCSVEESGAIGKSQAARDLGKPPFPTCSGEESGLAGLPSSGEESEADGRFQVARDLLLIGLVDSLSARLMQSLKI